MDVTCMNLKKISKLLFAAVALLGMASAANAIIVLSPGTPGVIPGTGYGPSNCEPGCVNTVFSTSGLSLLYKSDAGDTLVGADSGTFADSYTTWFYNDIGDPDNALLFFDGGPTISCPSCYLAVKDGRHSPGYYFYDLSSWNGIEAISLENFWPEGGAISHVSIWGRGGTTNVAEPSTLALLGLGLLALGVVRRRQRN
jgi:PEP-CTERM motif